MNGVLFEKVWRNFSSKILNFDRNFISEYKLFKKMIFISQGANERISILFILFNSIHIGDKYIKNTEDLKKFDTCATYSFIVFYSKNW